MPDGITRQKAIELAYKISSKLPVEFVLGQGTIPHITIYQATFPNKNIEKLKDIVREIASQTTPFEIEMGPFLANVGVPGFVWWNCIKTDIMNKVHLEIIDRANPLREGLVPDNLKNYSGPEIGKKEIEGYGSLLVKERYSPHITITRIKNPDDSDKVMNILGEEKSEFKADKIVLGYLGDHGTVTGIIEDFPLLS